MAYDNDQKLNIISEVKRPVTVAGDNEDEEVQEDEGQNWIIRAGYQGEEDDITCGRFPHLDVCGCDIQTVIALKAINLIQVVDGIFMGPFQSAFKTRDLLEAGVTHILNVTSKEYTKRKYF